MRSRVQATNVDFVYAWRMFLILQVVITDHRWPDRDKEMFFIYTSMHTDIQYMVATIDGILKAKL